MSIVFVFLISSLGLGHLLMKSVGLRDLWGFRAALGYCLIPIFVFIFHLIFKLDLRTSARATFAIGSLGLISLFFDNRTRLKEIFFHPVFTWGAPLTLFFFVFGPTDYIPTGTDEFSHWLTMPKQMFLEKALLSPNFLAKDFASYTPGWPILLIYTDLILSEIFDYSQIIYVAFFSGLVCMGALHDFIKDYFSDEAESLQKNTALVLTFIVGLVLLKAFAPKNILIETPMYHGILLFFVTTSLLLKKEQNTPWFFVLSIVTAYCYLLKHAFLTLVVLLPVIVILAGKNDFKKIIGRILILMGPFALLYFTWKNAYLSLNVPELFRPISVSSFEQLKVAFFERIAIFQKLPGEILYVLDRLWLGAKVAFLAFFIGRSYLDKKVYFLILLYLMIYLASLVWMYFTGFGLYEALILASFERYMFIPLVPLLFFGALNFAKWVHLKLAGRFHFWPKSNDRLYFCLRVFFLIFIAAAIKIKFYQITEFPKHSMLQEFDSLKKVISERNLKVPTLTVIAQGGNNIEFQIARFLAVGNQGYYFTMYSPETSFAAAKEDIWRSVKTNSEMLAFMKNPDVIWMVKSDAWLDSLLETYLTDPTCKPPYDQYFIFKSANRIECIRKRPASSEAENISL